VVKSRHNISNRTVSASFCIIAANGEFMESSFGGALELYFQSDFWRVVVFEKLAGAGQEGDGQETKIWPVIISATVWLFPLLCLAVARVTRLLVKVD
jgi:hypothetical protein